MGQKKCKQKISIIYKTFSEANFKIIVVGNNGVGKTSLIKRFISYEFPLNYIQTSHYETITETKILKIEKFYEFNLLDIPGWHKDHSEEFKKKADGIIFVYDISNRKSFNDLYDWLKVVDKSGLENVAKILVGNKLDLEN